MKRGRLGRKLVGVTLLAFASYICSALFTPVSAAPSQRVVIVGGTLTEIAFKLGAGGSIVGVDTTSTWPPETKKIKKVGYMRRLSAEGILSLDPDIVLISEKSGPKTAIDQLQSAGVPVLTAPTPNGIASIVPTIRFISRQLSESKDPNPIIKRFETQIMSIQKRIKVITKRPGILVLLSISRGPAIAAGSATSAHTMITLAGGRNVLSSLNGYKPVSTEAIIKAAPDFIVLPEHTAKSAGGIKEVISRPEIAATPAGRSRRIMVMDTLKLLGFGLRTPEAIAELAHVFHPSLSGLLAASQ